MESLASKMPALVKKYGLSEREIETIAEADPTPQKKYINWLINQVKIQQIRLPEDNRKVISVLKNFDKFKQRFKEKDINRYDYYSLDDAVDDLISPGAKTKGEEEREIKAKGASKIHEDDTYTIYKITTPEASCIYSKGTKWCVSDIEAAKEYLSKGPLYLIFKDNKKYAMFHAIDVQLMDLKDRPLEDKTLALLLSQINDIKKQLLSNPESAFGYAMYLIKDRVPEVEPILLNNPDYFAYAYAQDIIKGRWPELESVVLKNPHWAYQYAMRVIKGRWPEAEPIIMKDPKAAFGYAKNVIKGRWPEAEPIIMKDPKSNPAHFYVQDIIKKYR